MSEFTEPVTQSPTTDNKKTVVICIPGRSFSNIFFKCWTDTVVKLISSNKYNILLSNAYSSQVNFARELCLGANVLSGPDQQPFQGQFDYDVILWLDSDMVFNAEMIMELIDSCLTEHPVVSGIYAMERGELLCCVQDWDIDYYSQTGSFKFLTVEDGEQLIKENNNWIKCAYTGMGCMAIRKGVIEDPRLKYPWFFCDLKKLPSTKPEIPYICDGTSEDVSFIRNLIENGIIDGVMVNLKWRFGHEKMAVY
jgi:hypothetical protein